MSEEPVIAVATAAATTLLIGGWFAALVFVSPEQVAAAAKAPVQPALTGTIERGDLIETVAFPASVDYASGQSIPIAAIASTARTVVTAAPGTIGAQADIGSVLLEVNGQPVFLFEAPFPFYRDLRVGDHGPDVESLQRGLVAVGLLSAVDGTYGQRTAVAVSRLYKNAGYVAPPSQEPPAAAVSEQTSPPSANTAGAAGAFMPLSALAAATRVPVTIRSSPGVGDLVSDSTSVVVDAGSAQVRVQTREEDALQKDAVVHVTIDGAESFDGIVTSLGAPPQGGTADSSDGSETNDMTVVTVMRSDGTGIPADYVGHTASVSIERQVLAQDALIVPLSAVRTNSDGGGAIMVADLDGAGFRRIGVTIVASIDGRVAIASDDPAVHEGQSVKLG
ncbi:hypothetical protein IF188_13520 [Microbacterium sp. NEAU-LLC]|uniref:Peptidoglycan binding-like domain-containing protein n=1 Tax=Microbacterium helvum TaxID=2773713 RepID=A0ABR8NUI7_9MICO|nr:hypothetical protein [Microbacterium helvum]MBD3942716.1 hypothetical protein [Microbacterium helvum]